AVRFMAELKERLRKFSLELHSSKTRLIEFGRFAATRRRERGHRKPETFGFLGFTHICGETKDGHFSLLRHTMRDRMRAKLRVIKKALGRMMHLPLPVQGRWLG